VNFKAPLHINLRLLGVFSLRIPTIILYVYIIPFAHATCLTHPTVIYVITLTMLYGAQSFRNLGLCYFLRPLITSFLLSTSKYNLYSSLRRTPNFQRWSAPILSIGLPSVNSDENRSILAAVFTKHKRHQVQATTDGNFEKKKKKITSGLSYLPCQKASYRDSNTHKATSIKQAYCLLLFAVTQTLIHTHTHVTDEYSYGI